MNEEQPVTKPTYQQQLVVDCLQQLFDATKAASEANDKRAEKIATLAGAVVAFIGGASSLQAVSFAGSPLSAMALLIVFGLAVGIFVVCAKVWLPAAMLYPAGLDPQELYDDYIKQGVYEAYNQHLSSLAWCARQNATMSEQKAQRVDLAMKLVQAQAIAVAAMIFLRAFGL